ncbi:MAG TPA: hypothetical protein VFW13_15025, partial [Phenylobacterium sp.]|nr:hypothetical protein [Phenylobacterium sp.]
MFTYAPPANIDDLAGQPTREKFLTDWHDFVGKTFADELARVISDNPGIEPQFASEVDGAFAGQDIPVNWQAFPLTITRDHFNDSVKAWTAANILMHVMVGGVPVKMRPQDEYCEWFEYRKGGVLQRIVFTAEAPEYWIALAAHDLEKVVSLYQRLVDPAVKKADLLLDQDMRWLDNRILKAGTYNPYNPWNTEKGVMHLTHHANSLGAEIDLAAKATVVRGNGGVRVTDVRQLACCSDFGDPNRSSDPNIGHAVNTSCTPVDGSPAQDVTLANPVALYIDGLAPGTITGPNDEPLDNWFTFVRGATGHGLMAVLAPPAGAAFGLDQVKVKGIPLAYGGQVAEAIQMVLYAKIRPHAGAGVPVKIYDC